MVSVVGRSGRWMVEGRSAMDAVTEVTRILVVDDDPLLRGMAARTLRHAGFDVVEADSGEQALEAFESNPADLMLLDVMRQRKKSWNLLIS